MLLLLRCCGFCGFVAVGSAADAAAAAAAAAAAVVGVLGALCVALLVVTPADVTVPPVEHGIPAVLLDEMLLLLLLSFIAAAVGEKNLRTHKRRWLSSVAEVT